MSYVINLAKVSKNDAQIAGGKGASLGELLQAGFNVPAGFAVTTDAYAEFLAQEKMLVAVEKQIWTAFDAMKSTLVAVRSSAVAEDNAKSSWAGVLETYLHTTRDTLISSIVRCWQSMSSERAKLYGKPSPMAVVVQAMITSDVSGVAFSMHPVTNDSQQIYIEATSGVGESLVSGEVIPDSYVVDRLSAQVIESTVETGLLTPDQLRELSVTVIRIEKAFGFAIDVEWAFAAGTLYILQARPITTSR